HDHEEGHDHDHEGEHDHDHEEGHDHDHEGEHDHDHEEHFVADDSMEVTAVLLKYKTKMAVINMPRIINEQTNMQAALPGLEINRLFYMLGVGATTLKLIAGGIMLMAGFSVFFVLYNRLRDRKFELALLRSVGYRPGHLFGLLVLEGLILAVMGYVFGWFLSRAGLFVINQQAESDFNLQFGTGWAPGEEWLLLLTVTVGLVSALLPAWKAMSMDVSAILSEN
ncbi:MAG: FtsX-like permease family protein, partial [Cyanothece sp. SIO1E1]|nr:FtsX-like permease family protein [Cyanothece sp. SIO1E1]